MVTFLDDEARDQFHKANTTLQVICSLAESALFKYGMQLQVIEVEGRNLARLDIPDFEEGDFEHIKHTVIELNKQFRRVDGEPTISVIDLSLGILSFYVTQPQDFLTLM